jgi:hypothetical protein
VVAWEKGFSKQKKGGGDDDLFFFVLLLFVQTSLIINYMQINYVYVFAVMKFFKKK